MEQQRAKLSALIDDELERHDSSSILKSALHDESLRKDWQVYALIGDRLRGETLVAGDLVGDVMARLREEPVVLAPRKQLSRQSQHPLLALAASVAGIAVVAWLALSNNPTALQAESRFAAVSPAPTFASAPQMHKSWPGETFLRGDILRAQQLRTPAEPRFRSGMCELRCEK